MGKILEANPFILLLIAIQITGMIILLIAAFSGRNRNG